jgi:hypothetical protein
VGLDAVVYRNRKHLQLGSDEELARLVPETGEVYFDNDELSRKHRHQLETVGHRLGNIAAISALRDEATPLIGPESILLRKVIYSGTHSGDMIPLESLPLLSAELESISNANQQSPELRHFIRSLQELIRAANHEGNPIVFI